MIITKEVQVSIELEDYLEVLQTCSPAIMINRFAALLKSITDEQILIMEPSVRKVVGDFLIAQANRYAERQ